jgi:hypothetical protein
MAATFKLCFDPSCGQPIAKIGFGSLHGGLVEGDPILTMPCSSFGEFAEEIKQLHKELDKIEKEAQEKFASTPQAKEAQRKYIRGLKTLGQKNLAKFPQVRRNMI